MTHADDDILFRTVVHEVIKSIGALLVVGMQVGLVVSTERTSLSLLNRMQDKIIA